MILRKHGLCPFCSTEIARNNSRKHCVCVTETRLWSCVNTPGTVHWPAVLLSLSDYDFCFPHGGYFFLVNCICKLFYDSALKSFQSLSVLEPSPTSKISTHSYDWIILMHVISPSVSCSPLPTVLTCQTLATAHCAYPSGWSAGKASFTWLRMAPKIWKGRRQEPTLENSQITGEDTETSKWRMMY